MFGNIILTAIGIHCEQTTPRIIITQPYIVHATHEKDRLFNFALPKAGSYSSIQAHILFNKSNHKNNFNSLELTSIGIIKILLFNIIETDVSCPANLHNQKPMEISPIDIKELKAEFSRTADTNQLILSLYGKNDILEQHPIVKYLKNSPSKAFQLRVIFSDKLSPTLDKEIVDFIYDLETIILPLREIIEKDIAITAEKINESRFKNNKKKT
ncbi:hypothetical protein CDIK_4365 [Cucumispora dikerogammari]|nr:hypothetical protein CDIK_4365 [Cucumispora dikerogammari]